ncbi:hypothetical protein [Burkholderia cenocepacia]|nr:hypothetical protein [Burkholderia cenocepacia]
MTTYIELKAQLEALQQETAAARIAELQTMIGHISDVVRQYGLAAKAR